MSFKMGQLTPTCALDVVPGDIFQISVENMLRLAPLVSPVMHEIYVRTYFFFVPNRLIWVNWENFITGADDTLVLPYLDSDDAAVTEGSLGDYLGVPPGIPAGIEFSAMPFAAYVKIWNDWFRDENLQTELNSALDNGPQGGHLQTIQGDIPYYRAWEHDYFTAALPWAQKGDAVTLPLVEDDVSLVELSGVNVQGQLRKSVDGTVMTGDTNVNMASGTGLMQSTSLGMFYDPNGTLSVKINESAVTINQLREAFRMQEFLERDATGGSRYNETIYAHFGVRTKDSRLQRPELVGSFSGRMVISEVLQTAPGFSNVNDDGSPTPLGTMAGHGISVTGGKNIKFRATEHGWLIGLINVQPRTAYQQGLHKKWSRLDRFDFFWPKFAHIGEQVVANKELYVDAVDPDGEFGYVPRYAEYKFENSRVAGSMRDSLAHWHMGRIFESEPALNETFISCDPTTRIFAVEYEDGEEDAYAADQIFAHVYNNISASRLMPKYGKPML